MSVSNKIKEQLRHVGNEYYKELEGRVPFSQEDWFSLSPLQKVLVKTYIEMRYKFKSSNIKITAREVEAYLRDANHEESLSKENLVSLEHLMEKIEEYFYLVEGIKEDDLLPKEMLVCHCFDLKLAGLVKEAKESQTLEAFLEKTQAGKRCGQCITARELPRREIYLDFVYYFVHQRGFLLEQKKELSENFAPLLEEDLSLKDDVLPFERIQRVFSLVGIAIRVMQREEKEPLILLTSYELKYSDFKSLIEHYILKKAALVSASFSWEFIS